MLRETVTDKAKGFSQDGDSTFCCVPFAMCARCDQWRVVRVRCTPRLALRTLTLAGCSLKKNKDHSSGRREAKRTKDVQKTLRRLAFVFSSRVSHGRLDPFERFCRGEDRKTKNTTSLISSNKRW